MFSFVYVSVHVVSRDTRRVWVWTQTSGPEARGLTIVEMDGRGTSAQYSSDSKGPPSACVKD